MSTTPSSSLEPSPVTSDIFVSTHWTVVLAAGRRSDTEAQVALEELCRTYWFPLYAYIRRRGHSRENAEDLTQAFFARFVQKNYLADLQADHGRFRAFLLASLKHFLANEYDKAHRQKRSGTAPDLSLDWSTADTQFQLADSRALSPDQAFDREWALALLAKVIHRLQAEFDAEGQTTQFERFKPFLTEGKPEADSAQVAHELGLSDTALRVAIHRLRKRYRQLLRTEIAHTLADPSQASDELQALFAAFGR